MIINKCSHAAATDVDSVGIIIRVTGHNQNHVALLYKENNEALCFHHAMTYMELQPPQQDDNWLDLGDSFERRDKQYIHAEIIKIVRANNGNPIKFGFDEPIAAFGEDRNLEEDFLQRGFTCATFVLSVFESLGYTLLDYSAWPENEQSNIEWQKTLLGWITRHAEPDYIVEQTTKVGSRRFLPQEVVAATQLEFPVGYDTAAKMGEEINQAIQPQAQITPVAT